MTILPAVRAVAPRLPVDEARRVALALDTEFVRHRIAQPEAQARIVAQMAHECGGFTIVAENLNYSAARLVQVWPNRFPTPAAAAPYARNPRALAIKVYGARMGNRPGTEDGWTFRGSGWMQHTGRAEFVRVRAATGEDVVMRPDDLRDRARASLLAGAAVSYIAQRQGARDAAAAGNIRALTRAINGGTNGLDDRERLTRRAVAAVRNERVPTERTNHETAARTEAQGRAVGGGAVVSTGTVAVEQVARPEPSLGLGGAVALGAVILAVCGFVGWRLWRRHAAATTAVIRDRIETAELRSAAIVQP